MADTQRKKDAGTSLKDEMMVMTRMKNIAAFYFFTKKKYSGALWPSIVMH